MVDQDSGERHGHLVFGRWTPYLVVRVRALAEAIIWFPWAGQYPSPPRCINATDKFKAGRGGSRITQRWTNIPSWGWGGSDISPSCYLVCQSGSRVGLVDWHNLRVDGFLNSLYLSPWRRVGIVRRNVIFISGFYALVRFSQLITRSI